MITRDELELVVQKKKINEVHNWFYDHFIASPQQTYTTKCPFLIVQGPAGCGKTTALRCVAKELKLPIKEYSDTTDTTAISYEINQDQSDDDRSMDRRRASRFERFVFNNLRFNPLYASEDFSEKTSLAREDSEFDESDDDMPNQSTERCSPTTTGIIIHVESPLMFSRSQKVFISSIARMIKMIRDLSKLYPRRIAVVFETLESDRDMLSLPTKFKQTIGMQMIKFNPIIRANMRKFIESILRKYQDVIIGRETVDTLITDCNGDLLACINSLEMIRNRTRNYNNVYMELNESGLPLNGFQVNKRQRLNPERYQLKTSLLRDVTRSLGFFHTLGKVFYQKRIYPEKRHINGVKSYRAIDRPFKTENDTEFLVSRLEAEPKKLLPWLHQHYYKFCHDSNIEKASLFMNYLSDIDNISINSFQSSQFYEMHSAIDQVQLYLAVESTVYSLYEDQSNVTKTSHKKNSNALGTHIIKSSVENFSQNGNGDLYSFSKPASLSMWKVIEDHQSILAYCFNELGKHNLNCVDATKVLVDYLPYIKSVSDSCSELAKSQLDNKEFMHKICNDDKVIKLISLITNLSDEPKLDYDLQHEALTEVIEEMSYR